MTDKHYAEHKRCLAVCGSEKLNFTMYSLPDVVFAHPVAVCDFLSFQPYKINQLSIDKDAHMTYFKKDYMAAIMAFKQGI